MPTDTHTAVAILTYTDGGCRETRDRSSASNLRRTQRTTEYLPLARQFGGALFVYTALSQQRSAKHSVLLGMREQCSQNLHRSWEFRIHQTATRGGETKSPASLSRTEAYALGGCTKATTVTDWKENNRRVVEHQPTSNVGGERGALCVLPRRGGGKFFGGGKNAMKSSSAHPRAEKHKHTHTHTKTLHTLPPCACLEVAVVTPPPPPLSPFLCFFWRQNPKASIL